MRRFFRRPRAVLAVMTILVLGVGHRALLIQLDNSPETFFTADEEARERYQAMVETFGSDEVVLVELGGARLDSAEDLQTITRLAAEVESLPGVVGVLSVAQVVEQMTDEPQEELDEMVVEGVAREVQALPLYRKLGIVRPELPSLALIASIVMQGPRARTDLTRALQEVAERHAGSRYAPAVAGLTPTHAAFDRQTRRSMFLFMPATVVAMILLGLALFRSVRALVALFFPVAGTALLGVAGLELAGQSLNLVTAVLPPLVLAIGFAGAIHLVSHYATLCEEGLEHEDAALRTIQDKLTPTAFAFGTTALGFGSLGLSGVPSVMVLGLGSAATLLTTLVLVTFGTPCFLLVLRPRIHMPPHRRRLLENLARFSLGRRWLVLAGAVVLVGLAAAGIPRLRSSINGMQLLPEDMAERTTYERLEREGLGLANLELWLHLPLPDDAALLAAAPRLERLAGRLDGLPRVTGVVGVHDLLQSVNYRMTGSAALPLSLAALELLPPAVRQDFHGQLDHFRHQQHGLKLTIFSLTADTEQQVESLKRAIGEAAAEFFPGVEAEITGHYAMLIATPGSLMQTLVESLVLTVVVVAALFLLFLRSPGLALAGMAANLLPVAVAIAVMGWIGIPLDVATVMMGSVAFGIAVDDTFHYMFHLRRSGSITRAAAIAGQGIVGTTIVVASGFGVLGLSGFTPMIRFGLLTAFAALVALIVDALLLPALVGRRTEKAGGE